MDAISSGFSNIQLTESRISGGTNYIIDRKIGNGQFSMVYKAKSLATNTNVAVKKVHIFELMDSKNKLDCIREINILKELSHRNVIQYMDSYIEDNILCIVLELADGGDLSQMIFFFITHQRLFGEKTIWKYFSELCSAVEHMHIKRIMHRDIKPANVFITAKGIVKLGDLGLGRYFSSKTDDVHTLVGTPYYMSPERILEQAYDFRSDIWSLGCLLYEMAALQSPFYSKNVNLKTLCKKIKNCDYPPIPSDKYSVELYSIVEKCIQSSPEHRPDINYLTRFSQDLCKFYLSNNLACSDVRLLLTNDVPTHGINFDGTK